MVWQLKSGKMQNSTLFFRQSFSGEKIERLFFWRKVVPTRRFELLTSRV